ncbi:MAG: hydantoinase B/oxoprolinase family protein [Rhodospirillaceae bacterium]|nr:hydantoinase B/oxoprolinase family protein [Rhodospirillaceae bacterium]
MGWQFWIDRGGTFTDIVALSPSGTLKTAKYLSEDRAHYADAAVHGMRALLGLGPHEPFPANTIDAIKIGTTVATNALLERKGEPTALAVTQGFGDVLRIGTQHRPRLFDLNIKLPSMLYSRVAEIPERVSAIGDVTIELDRDAARAALTQLRADGLQSIAIVLMHADRFPDHEKILVQIARDVGFTQISASHQVSPVMKFIGRGDTTVADAYLSPVVRRYVESLVDSTAGAPIYFMQSNGGLAAADRFHGKDAILSGPAGGIVGATETARHAGFSHIIAFDMGGTSTDVSHVAGDFERAYDTEVAGVRLRVPMMKIHTIAAGGGSVCTFDGLRLRVGPESAGADPGPACYRKGGPLTVTDCNVALGRIQGEFFPTVFGTGADQPIDAGAAMARLTAEVRAVKAATGRAQTPESLAEDFIAIAVDNMARAIKRVSIEQGHDISDYALAAFGGAGGQHACLVAEALDLKTVIIHPMAGVLSAFGIGLAKQRATRQRSIDAPLGPDACTQIKALAAELARDAERDTAGGPGAPAAALSSHVHLRLSDSEKTFAVAMESEADMRHAFAKAYQRHFGFAPDSQNIVCDRIEVEATAAGHDLAPPMAPTATEPAVAASTVKMWSKGQLTAVPVFKRDALAVGWAIAGPAIIAEATATTVVEAGWSACVMSDGHLVLTRQAAPAPRTKFTTRRDPALIEIFNNLFMSVAERMGAVLQSSARSINIKERLDFSCAIFDGAGQLIANAPHMPVHLGSMGDSVRAVRAKHEAAMRPGDSFVLNSPYDGGTHLPDITVITPVFVATGDPAFYVAARGHHADIGGITPGSMPPHSRSIVEEGVLIDNIRLVSAGRFETDAIKSLLGRGPHPARNIDQCVADLKAQVAATVIGARDLVAMCERYGFDVVNAYMGHVLDFAEEAVRRAIGRLSPGIMTCPMDDGGVIKVSVTIDRETGTAVVDFNGTSAQRPTNFNAPRAICRAAVLYVFRTLIAEDIPLNDGCMRPIRLIIPEGSMLDPKPPAAVVAGNVETSQIICDALYGALGVLAASQGTMNNFTFGDDTHQYYETICGGAGAGATFDGASAVQTHMTNSRLTDPEMLERRYPVVVERFAIRQGSGGAGRHRGGDGVERRIRFLKPMTAAILSGRRITRPFGLAGGQDGAAGETFVTHADGSHQALAATAEVQLQVGDRLTIKTPGGGGFGKRT